MKVDIGIASYQNPNKLDAAIRAIRLHSRSDWRLLVVDNASPDPEVRRVIERHAAEDSRVIPLLKSENTGYAGAVNDILDWAESDYVAYSDNDAYIQTAGWDVRLAALLDAHPKVAMAFPTGRGAYPIPHEHPDVPYNEVLWSVGCFWMLRGSAAGAIGRFDETLGHQEEVDYQTRLRMAGWTMAMHPLVEAQHDASASSSPESEARITRGVVNWMNKWVAYFCGSDMDYFSDNVLRFEDWHPNALYLERYYKMLLPNLNDNPEQIILDTRRYDLLRVPRCAWTPDGGLYRGRII